MKRTPPEVLEFIRSNVAGLTAKELAERLNSALGVAYSAEQIRTLKVSYNLKSGRRGVPAGRPSKVYPSEIQSFIQKNHIGVSSKKMAGLLNAAFGTSYTAGQIKAYYESHGINSGVTGRFQKGHVPANNARKGYCAPGCEKGWFPKGNIPTNHKPVGSERIEKKDGYVLIKTAEPNIYRQKHIVVWEQAYGPVPEGHVVTFIDGDKYNLRLANLRLITKAENATLNFYGVRGPSEELLELGLLVVKARHLRNARAQKRKKPAVKAGEAIGK